MLLILFVLSGMCAYAQEGFKIVGRLGGTLGGNLMLVANGPQGAVKLGEASMVNGSFEFTGKVDSLTPAYVMIAEQQPVATLMLENVEFAIVAGKTGIEVQGGGEAQQVLNQYNAISQLIGREQMKLEAEAQSAYASGNQMKLQALQQQFEKVVSDAQTKQAALFEEYKDSPVTAFVVASAMGQMDYASLKAVYDQLGDGAKSCLYGRMIARQIEVFKQVEVGSVAPDFSGMTAEGETVSLHGIKAKVKLVDFWASWCGPCRAEMPNVRKVYKKYHESGLEILGVSLDEKRDAWTKAMRDDQMTWPNISDLLGWRSPMAALYLVRAIPATFLLDEDNRIVAKNLRGKELEKKIAELLGD